MWRRRLYGCRCSKLNWAQLTILLFLLYYIFLLFILCIFPVSSSPISRPDRYCVHTCIEIEEAIRKKEEEPKSISTFHLFLPINCITLSFVVYFFSFYLYSCFVSFSLRLQLSLIRKSRERESVDCDDNNNMMVYY